MTKLFKKNFDPGKGKIEISLFFKSNSAAPLVIIRKMRRQWSRQAFEYQYIKIKKKMVDSDLAGNVL